MIPGNYIINLLHMHIICNVANNCEKSLLVCIFYCIFYLYLSLVLFR